MRAVRRAPVVNHAGALVGIVSMDDLLPILASELGALASLIGTQARHERSV
jgi:CBS domain-containing protein